MGYNATVVVLVDHLDAIASDPNFGKNLANAVQKTLHLGQSVDGSADCGNIHYCNVATVVEGHHASGYVNVKVGGNMGEVVDKEKK